MKFAFFEGKCETILSLKVEKKVYYYRRESLNLKII
jgi:hypothetical protein